jgi:hypothetical protein
MICILALRVLSVALLVAPAATAYIRLEANTGGTFTGVYLHRPDFANIQFFLGVPTPGLRNSDGNTFVTADSDVNGAVAAALNAWSTVPGSAVNFAPVQSGTPATAAQQNNAILFLDSPGIRSALGTALAAVTSTTWSLTDGTIVASDILFNPSFTFSTNAAGGTFDIQSVLTHELGHTLGANHTNVVGSAMFQQTFMTSTLQRTLSADDMAFASGLYVALSTANGAISGTLTLSSTPVHGALITAIDTISGATISSLTSTVDGTFTIFVPPGNYILYTEPLTGTVGSTNLFLNSTEKVDTGFQPSISGGTTPVQLAVTTGVQANGDFSPSSGTGSLQIQSIYRGSAGATGDDTFLQSVGVPLGLVSGQSVDLLVSGTGIDATLSDSNVLLFGPVTLQPGSIRQDAVASAANGATVMRMTVNLQPVTTQTTTTLILSKGGSVSSFTGGLVLLPQ